VPQHSYADLAAGLRTLADQFDVLASTHATPPERCNVYLNFYTYNPRNSSLEVAAVDAAAAAMGATATTKFEGRGSMRRGERRYDADRGGVGVHGYTSVPVPPTRAQKLADLQRENDELRAKLSAGGQA
jgi:hypothetical protein